MQNIGNLQSPRIEQLFEARTKIGEKALSKGTINNRRCYARKFLEVILTKTKTDWDPAIDLAPPLKLLTDENISLFFTNLWTTHNPGKSQIENGKRYINFALAQHQKPSVGRRGSRSNYPQTWTLLKGIQNSKRWTGTGSQGAKPLTKEEVRKIMLAPVRDLDDLRNKVIANCYMHMGFHKKDVQRLRDSNLEDHPTFKDRNGLLKPKIVIRGEHNKRKYIKVRNIVACGCPGEHNWRNQFCEYALWKLYMVTKRDHDEKQEKETFKRMNNNKKKKHFEGEDLGPDRVLKEMNFMRGLSLDKTHYLHQNMGIHQIAEGLEYWNKKLKLRPDQKITSDMARKTFCTLGSKFFKFQTQQIRDVTHHETDENFQVYVCDEYVDLEEESHISVTMQKWAQKRYNPPVHMTPSVMLHELQEAIGSVQKMMLLQSQIMMRQLQVCVRVYVCVCVCVCVKTIVKTILGS